MKILLIKPQMHPDNVQPPLGLGYLASTIHASGHSVEIIDFELLRKGTNRLFEILIEHKPDIVGVQCYTYGIEVVKKYLKAIKSFNNSIITVLGGPQVTVSPEDTLSYMTPFVDYLITGEAEFEFPKLINLIAGGNNPESQIISAGHIEDLDDIPFPLWEKMNPANYPPAPHGAFYQNFPIAPVVASRGCPYNCYFCQATILSGSRVRYRTIENLVEEIEFLIRRFGVREIHFVDDNFTFDKKYVMKFCDCILSRGLKLSFSCPNGVRIDSLDKELLDIMKRAGFYSLSLGIESGSQRILDRINKKITIEQIRKAVDLINSSNIAPVGFFIVGFPFETKEDIESTIEFASSLKLRLANFMLYHPLPSTVLFEEMKDEGLINNIDYNAVSFSHSAYAHRDIDKKTLKLLQIKAFLKFYSKPFTFYNTLRGIKSPRHFYYILKRIKRWLISSWFNR